ncbi:hypothetical protein B296_00012803 [Ensete ventricosum]|uniref:Uncharacterized protein n=1 Tax=Ensete ventricosum TaxID=4639 RepID=A0A427AIP5_ENSVE|nr:hypothetical protein B296_00012803 [Ensete ventricosum]
MLQRADQYVVAEALVVEKHEDMMCPRAEPSRGPPLGLPRRRTERAKQTIREKWLLKTPNPMKSWHEDRDHKRYCRFHRNYRHNTEECYDLKNQIEDLIRHGHLDRYTRKPREPFLRPKGTVERQTLGLQLGLEDRYRLGQRENVTLQASSAIPSPIQTGAQDPDFLLKLPPAQSASSQPHPPALSPDAQRLRPTLGRLLPSAPCSQPEEDGRPPQHQTILTIDAPQLRHDGGEVLICPRSVLNLIKFPYGVHPLKDLLKFYYPFALIDRGPRGAPRSVHRLFVSHLPQALPQTRPCSELGCFSTVDALASPAAGMLAADGIADPLPTPPSDFILSRLNISAQQKFGLIDRKHQYGTVHYPRSPLDREAPAPTVGNEEKARLLTFVAGRCTAHTKFAVSGQVIHDLPLT